MTPETLAEKVLSATRAAFEALALDAAVLPAVTAVERPRDPKHGDYASNIAMQTAKKAGTNPRALAEKIAEHLAGTDGVAKVDIAGPGFLNITLDAAAAGEIAGKVVATGPAYGDNDSMAGHQANLEFVSANPTGPMHIGARPLGRRRRRPRPCHAGLRREAHLRVLLQRRRRADRQLQPPRCSPAPEVSRLPRTATAGPTSTRSPLRSSRTARTSSMPRTRGSCSGGTAST